jgi:transcriptional regulator with XRE-family HTH domain
MATLPSQVRQALAALGQNLNIARRRRRQSRDEFARRLGVSRPTVERLEKGDPKVSAGAYFTALWAVDLLPTDLADPAKDRAGIALERRRLPKRARRVKTEEPDLDF